MLLARLELQEPLVPLPIKHASRTAVLLRDAPPLLAKLALLRVVPQGDVPISRPAALLACIPSNALQLQEQRVLLAQLELQTLQELLVPPPIQHVSRTMVLRRNAPTRLTKPAWLQAVPHNNVPLSRQVSLLAKLLSNAPRRLELRKQQVLRAQFELQALEKPLVPLPFNPALLLAVLLPTAPTPRTKHVLLLAVPQRSVPLSRLSLLRAKLLINAPQLVLLRTLLELQELQEQPVPLEGVMPLVPRLTRLAVVRAVLLRKATPRLTKPALPQAMPQGNMPLSQSASLLTTPLSETPQLLKQLDQRALQAPQDNAPLFKFALLRARR